MLLRFRVIIIRSVDIITDGLSLELHALLNIFNATVWKLIWLHLILIVNSHTIQEVLCLVWRRYHFTFSSKYDHFCLQKLNMMAFKLDGNHITLNPRFEEYSGCQPSGRCALNLWWWTKRCQNVQKPMSLVVFHVLTKIDLTHVA